MKILLLNDNPVVNKLVTLSAQKTSDDLEAATTLDEINIDSCDLLVIDDTLYSDEVMQELKEKVQYTKSLYICSKNSEIIDGFSSILRKPFLPTDLVEKFLQLSKEIDLDSSIESSESTKVDEQLEEFSNQELEDSQVNEEELNSDEKSDEVESFEEVDSDILTESSEGVKVDELEEFSGQEIEEVEEPENDELSLDELDSEELSLEDLEEDNILLDEDDLENMDDFNLDETVDSVLDKDDLQEVQELLEATSDGLNEANYDTELDELEEFSNQASGELELDDEDLNIDEKNVEVDELEDEEVNLDELESEELELNEEELEEVNLDSLTEPSKSTKIDELEEFSNQELEESQNEELSLNDIEEQIESAEEELTQEDLESEVSLDDFDSLTTNDLKLAIGEAVTEDSSSESSQSTGVNDLEELSLESELKEKNLDANISTSTEITSNNDGVEKLKKLLEALTNEEVAAAMKGMKININIELGS